MFRFPTLVRPTLCTLLAFATLSPITVAAQDASHVFDGAALDAALTDLNAQLQARYRQDDALASLSVAVPHDFQQVAAATSLTPLSAATLLHGEFGVSVSGDHTLNVQLATFQADLRNRQVTLFARLAALGVGGSPAFDTVARDVWTANAALSGQVSDDPSLDAEMRSLSEGLQAFDDRDARLSPPVTGVTDASFDRYGAALLLLY